jgi:hypothetical protein
VLLRHGIVYYGGKPWTGPHDRWLRARRELLTLPGLGARRDRLDAAIAGWPPTARSPQT